MQVGACCRIAWYHLTHHARAPCALVRATLAPPQGVFVGVQADPHISVALEHMQSLIGASSSLAAVPAAVSSGGSDSSGGSPTAADDWGPVAPKVEPLAPGVVAPPAAGNVVAADSFDYSLPLQAPDSTAAVYNGGDAAADTLDAGDDADWAELVSVLT